jgi:hypothetical protein
LFRPFQENKFPKNGEFSERKASGLGGFNFWNYLSVTFHAMLRHWFQEAYPAPRAREAIQESSVTNVPHVAELERATLGDKKCRVANMQVILLDDWVFNYAVVKERSRIMFAVRNPAFAYCKRALCSKQTKIIGKETAISLEEINRYSAGSPPCKVQRTFRPGVSSWVN